MQVGSTKLRILTNLRCFCRCVSYVQGQSPTPKTREYFYYVDHQGQLFLDDTKVKNFITCFKDKKFLAFFFKHVRANTTARYREGFPFVSPCGREMNHIHCDDVPLVYTHLLDSKGEAIQDIITHASSQSNQSTNEQQSELLSYGGAGNLLTVSFQPEKLCMLPGTGRVYHSGPDVMGGVGLVKSSLAIELSRFFQYEEGANPEAAAPVRFTWRGRLYELDNSVVERLKSHQLTE